MYVVQTNIYLMIVDDTIVLNGIRLSETHIAMWT